MRYDFINKSHLLIYDQRHSHSMDLQLYAMHFIYIRDESVWKYAVGLIYVYEQRRPMYMKKDLCI